MGFYYPIAISCPHMIIGTFGGVWSGNILYHIFLADNFFMHKCGVLGKLFVFLHGNNKKGKLCC